MTQFVIKVLVACVAFLLVVSQMPLSLTWSQDSIGDVVGGLRPNSTEIDATNIQFLADDIGVVFKTSQEPVFELASAKFGEAFAYNSEWSSTRRSPKQAFSTMDSPPSPIHTRPESPGNIGAPLLHNDQVEFAYPAADNVEEYIAENSLAFDDDSAALNCNHVDGACRCRCKRCRKNCGSRLGRFCHLVSQSICCPDPCYRSHWTMVANASFFTEAVRPQARQRFRWEYNNNFRFPDRAEFLWGRGGATGPAAETSIDFHDLTYFVETGGDRLSLFVETPYRSIDLGSGGHFAGFADLTTGTKTLLHDTELLQIAMQFEIHIPSSNPLKGLSNGHVTLTPALLFGIKTSERSYLQMQIAEGIPIAGDPDFAGAYLNYSASLNRVIWGDTNNTSLIRTLEYTGVTFQDGAFTDTTAGNAATFTSGESFGMLGSGLRLNVCNKFNFGIGGLFRVTNISPDATIRTEIQFRH